MEGYRVFCAMDLFVQDRRRSDQSETEQRGVGSLLTTVQQRGQNHHMKSRARSRNSTSNVISRMVPSNCGGQKHNMSLKMYGLRNKETDNHNPVFLLEFSHGRNDQTTSTNNVDEA